MPSSRDAKPLTLLFSSLLLMAVLVNPLRESASDDDWAYAMMVRDYVATGEYQISQWAAANMPFQINWGALWCRIFGFSFGVLNVSTFVLSLMGAAAMYFLAREHGVEPWGSAVVALLFAGGPLQFRFSLNYMTDMPYASLVTIAILIYTKGFRRRSLALVMGASAVAAAAILTRQFGVALIAAAGSFGILFARQRKIVLLAFAGCVLPAAAGAWQIAYGAENLNWAGRLVRSYQSDFMRFSSLAHSMAWRPGVIAQYAAFFLLPLSLMPLILFMGRRVPALAMCVNFVVVGLLLGVAGVLIGSAMAAMPWLAETPYGSRRNLLKFAFIIIVVAGLFQLHQWWRREGETHGRGRFSTGDLTIVVCAGAYIVISMTAAGYRLMPYLPWNLGDIRGTGMAVAIAFTGMCITGGTIAIWRGAVYFRALAGKGEIAHWFLPIATFWLMMTHVVYHKIGDEYLFDMIPFFGIVLAVMTNDLSGRTRKAFSVLVAMVLMVSVLWVRDKKAASEAAWRSAEWGVAQGIPAANIAGPWYWVSYYGELDKYLQAVDYSIENASNNYFEIWLPRRFEESEYYVIDGASPPATGEVLHQEEYRNFTLRKRSAYLVKKSEDGKRQSERQTR